MHALLQLLDHNYPLSHTYNLTNINIYTHKGKTQMLHQKTFQRFTMQVICLGDLFLSIP